MKYYQLFYKNFNERDLFYFSTNYIEKNTFKSKILINIKKFSKKKQSLRFPRSISNNMQSRKFSDLGRENSIFPTMSRGLNIFSYYNKIKINSPFLLRIWFSNPINLNTIRRLENLINSDIIWKNINIKYI